MQTREPASAGRPAVVPRPALPRVLDGPPPGRRVLVLAPHPDDESAGPGALLAAHAARGDDVSVVFATTGVHGDPEGARDPAAYVALRRREAEAACDVLGVGARVFWDYPDGMTVTEDDLSHVAALIGVLLRDGAPDVIYAPHPGECHADHHVLGLAALSAHAACASRAALYGYEVWSPLAAPDLVLDVTGTYPAKLRALRCYASQLAHTDVLGAIEGLNRYRAMLLPRAAPDGRRRAEALAVLA